MTKLTVAALGLISAVLLYFGLTAPIIEIVFDLEKLAAEIITANPAIGILLAQFGGVAEVLSNIPDSEPTRQSILSSVNELYKIDALVPAALILIFSVLTPILKQFLVIAGVVLPANKLGALATFARFIHKWAMLDVFVVAIVVVLLSNSDFWTATLREGLYYFLGYFFVSFAAFEMIYRSAKTSEGV